MLFPPESFLDVARTISTQKALAGEGRHRTVTSRAYYGAYWATCVAICKNQKISPFVNFGHAAITQRLAGTKGDDEMREFGTVLDSLRQSRVSADYNLYKPMDEPMADSALEDAAKVLELLPKVSARLPKFDPPPRT